AGDLRSREGGQVTMRKLSSRAKRGIAVVLAEGMVASFLTTALFLLPASLPAQERAIAIRGGTVLPVSGPAIPNGTVVIRGGKIVGVGANVARPAGAEIVDASGKYVMPGVIDAASHIGIDANDLNEPTDPMTPQHRARAHYKP